MRNIGPNASTELDKVVTYPIEIVSFEISPISTENLYLSTGYKEFTFRNNTYTPGAGVVGFSAIEETKDAKTNSITVNLNGVPNTIIKALEQIDGQGEDALVYKEAIGGIVTIYQGFWDEANGTLLQKDVADADGNTAEVYQKWQGIITSFNVTEENQLNGTVRIGIDCRSSIGTLLDTKAGRFTSDNSFINSQAKQLDARPWVANDAYSINAKVTYRNAIYNATAAIPVNTDAVFVPSKWTNITDRSMEFVERMIDFNPRFGAED